MKDRIVPADGGVLCGDGDTALWAILTDGATLASAAAVAVLIPIPKMA